jgi:hypothetical protein
MQKLNAVVGLWLDLLSPFLPPEMQQDISINMGCMVIVSSQLIINILVICSTKILSIYYIYWLIALTVTIYLRLILL